MTIKYWVEDNLCIEKQKGPNNWELQYSMFHFPVRIIIFILYRVIVISLVYFSQLFSVGQIWFEPQVCDIPYNKESSLSSNMSWFMAMIAFMKSENIPITCKPLSEASCRISTEDWVVVSVDFISRRTFVSLLIYCLLLQKLLTC